MWIEKRELEGKEMERGEIEVKETERGRASQNLLLSVAVMADTDQHVK